MGGNDPGGSLQSLELEWPFLGRVAILLSEGARWVLEGAGAPREEGGR